MLETDGVLHLAHADAADQEVHGQGAHLVKILGDGGECGRTFVLHVDAVEARDGELLRNIDLHLLAERHEVERDVFEVALRRAQTPSGRTDPCSP